MPPIYFAYISKNWIWIYIIVLILSCIAPFLLLILPESPKFLYEEQKFARLRKVLARIGRFNNKTLPGDYKLEAEEENSHVKHSLAIGADPEGSIVDRDGDDENEQYVPTTWQMLGHRVILINFIVVILSFSCASFNIYMIGFYMKYIDGDFWTNSILGASSQCIAFLCVIPT